MRITRQAIARTLVALMLATFPNAYGQGRPTGEGGGGGGDGDGNCTLFDLNEIEVGSEPGSGSIPVQIGMYCSWSATVTGGSWLRITGGSQGRGPGTVTFVYDRFTEPCGERDLNIVVEGPDGSIVTTVIQYGPVNASCPLEELILTLLDGLCPLELVGKASPGGETSLELARRFRDEVLAATPRGRDYTRRYYAFSPEIVRIMVANPRLGFRAARTLERYTPTLRSVLDGPGATIGGADLDEIDRLLAEVSAHSSLGLKRAIAGVRRDMRNPEVQAECRLAVEPGPSRLPQPASAAQKRADDPAAAYAAILGAGRFGQPSVPDVVAQAARGSYYLRTAGAHLDEIRSILASHPLLFVRLAGRIQPLQTMVHAIVENGEAAVDAAELAEIDGLLQSIADEASPELRLALGQVRRDLRDPSALGGFGLVTETRASSRSTPRGPAEQRAAEAYARLPLAFAPSQTDRRRFVTRGSGYRLDLSPTDAVVNLGRASAKTEPAFMRMRIAGANPDAAVAGLERLPGTTNLLVGERAAWRTNVPTFAKVRYGDVYPGIDLVYYGNQRNLEYDFVVAPGASPERITLAFDDEIAIDDSGDLVVKTAGGGLRHRAPAVYQEVGGSRRHVAGAYTRKGPREVGFELGAYDPSRPLVIDPELDYASYLGGGGSDLGADVAVDAEGNAYVVGLAGAAVFSVSTPGQTAFRGGASDAFVAKMNPEGTALVYSTYLGGSAQDYATGIAVDAAGNAYVSGVTNSRDFPVAGALQERIRGTNSGFLTKLDASGSALVYSTYLGGSSYDVASGVAVDAGGNAYVAGAAFSSNLATPGSFSSENGGFSDAFVAKVNSTGSTLVFATYLGGSGFDEAADVAVDRDGNVYVTGVTTSADFPTRAAVQSTNGGLFDAFVAKLNPSGSALVYSTYLGGSEPDGAGAIAVDASGNAYVTGATASENFPVARPVQAAYGGGMLDAFVAKLAADGASLAFSTFLGGGDDDRGYRLAIDRTGRAFVTGYTASSNFPVRDAVQPQIGTASVDAFVAEIGADDATLVFSTYLGGTGDETGMAIAVGDGKVFVLGVTDSEDFPTAVPMQPIKGGLFDAFVAKIAVRPSVPPPVIASAAPLEKPGKPFRVRITGTNFQQGLQVFIGADTTAWPTVKRRGEGTLILGKGETLSAKFPHGVATPIRLVNPDGGVAIVEITR